MHPYTVTKGKPRHLAEVRLHASSLLVTHSQVKLSFAVVVLRRGQETGEGRLVVAGSRALQTWNTASSTRSDALHITQRRSECASSSLPMMLRITGTLPSATRRRFCAAASRETPSCRTHTRQTRHLHLVIYCSIQHRLHRNKLQNNSAIVAKSILSYKTN